MNVTREQLSPTSIKLTIQTDQAKLDHAKESVLKQLSKNVKVPGFRDGKAPVNLVEKQIDQAVLQSEVIDHVINEVYVDAVEQEKIRPVAQPQIAITKFVPFSDLEFTAEIEVVGDIKLPDYKKIKLAAESTNVTANDVTEVLNNLATRGATKEEVTRPAKSGDEVIIDFVGTDAKTNEPLEGGAGTDYPLVLGSNTFIPGFEDELIGAKPGATKTFDITFPTDYGSEALQNKKVTFAVTIHKVNAVKPATIDDAFATTIGPFKTVDELKTDIKKQLTAEREQEAQRAYDNQLLERIADKSEVAIPAGLIEEEIDRIEEEEKRNTVYRGQTWQEHLDAEGLTAEEHHEKQREGATLRVKAGLVLGEIAQTEKITVSPDELELRIELLRGQYTDPNMQAELDKPENRRDIMSRILTEKTLDKLRSYATSK
ncbi:MAG: Trigger factor [Candidatus Saccharibacteria bacterium]|nr:Trigger factor [Candidatus Saccharibacteria bacterium]